MTDGRDRIRPFLGFGYDSLVNGAAEGRKVSENSAHAALDLALFIGIFYSDIKNAAGSVSHPLAYKGREKISDVHKSRGAGSVTGHPRTLLKLSFGKTLFALFGSFGYIGEKEHRKLRVFIFCHFYQSF